MWKNAKNVTQKAQNDVLNNAKKNEDRQQFKLNEAIWLAIKSVDWSQFAI